MTAIIFAPHAMAHEINKPHDKYYPHIPTSYLIARNYSNWSDQYDSENELLNWYKGSREYLAMDPVNEFNRLMQEGFLYRQNFDTVAGSVDAGFEVAALVVARQKLDGTYWSLSEHNDRFWNDLVEYYNITSIEDSKTLDQMIDKLAGNIHHVYIMEWFTLLDQIVYHGYTTPDQVLNDPSYWASIVLDSPLIFIPAGGVAHSDEVIPQSPRGKLENKISTYNSHTATYYGHTHTTYGGTTESGSWADSISAKGTAHGFAIIIISSTVCGDPPAYSQVTIKAKSKSTTPSDEETTPYKSKTKNTSGGVCISADARAIHNDVDEWEWDGKSTAKISYLSIHNVF